MILLILQNKQYIYNALLLIIGLILSQSSQFIFLDHVCQSTEWLCFLRSPINNNLILISLFSVPLLFYKTPNAVPAGSSTTQLPTWRSILPMYKKGIGHGFLGFIVGFTPGVGVSLASNLSASIEKYRNKFRSLSYIAAAEGANNSAAISCLIPFLFLGLPITPSELIIDQFLVSKFYRLNLDTINHMISISGDSINFITVIVTAIVLCNIVCFMLCGNFIRLWKNLLAIDIRWYLAIIKILVVCSAVSIVYAGQIPWTTAIFDIVAFGGFGYWAMQSNRDVMGLAVSMMLGPFIIEKFTMAYYLYF
jgi:TctA family transporter